MNSKNMHLTEFGEYIKFVVTTLKQTLDVLMSKYTHSLPHISYTLQTTIPESNKMDMYSLLTPTEIEVNNTVMDILIKIKTSNAVAAKLIYHHDIYDSRYKLSEFIKISEDNIRRDVEYRIPIYADFKNQNTTLNEFLKLFNKDMPSIYDLFATMEFVTAVMIAGPETGIPLSIDDVDKAIQYYLDKYITDLRKKRREG